MMFNNSNLLASQPTSPMGADQQRAQRQSGMIRPKQRLPGQSAPTGQQNTGPARPMIQRQPQQPQINPYQPMMHQNLINQQKTLQPPDMIPDRVAQPYREMRAEPNPMDRVAQPYREKMAEPNLLGHTNPAQSTAQPQISPEMMQQIQQREMLMRQRFGDTRGISDQNFMSPRMGSLQG